MKHLLSRIEKMMPGFSKGQRCIAQYIEDHYDKAAFMTASKLGATVGVSESTVVRFATEVGYDGYPQLQKAMQEMIRNKLTSVQRIEVTSNRIGDADVLDSVLNQDIDKIRRTLEETSHKDFYEAVDAIVSARKIYILAARSASALGIFLNYYFSLIFDKVELVTTTSKTEIYEKMFRINEEDVFIGISFPRYSMRTMKALEFANSRKAKVITITDSVHSPMNVYAACTLIAKSDMASIVDSLVAPLSVINALVVALCMKRQADVKKTLESMEKLWDEYQVYSNDEINGLDDARPMGGKKAALPVKEKA